MTSIEQRAVFYFDRDDRGIGGPIPEFRLNNQQPREAILDQIPFLQERLISFRRYDVPMAKITAEELGHGKGSMYAHAKDPNIVTDNTGQPAPIDSGDYHLHFTGDIKTQGGLRSWGLLTAPTPEGPWTTYLGNESDNYGVHHDTLTPLHWLFKAQVMKDVDGSLITFLPTQTIADKSPTNTLNNRDERLATRFEYAMAQNPEGTVFKSHHVALDSEVGEEMYDASPFVDENGRKSLAYVSRRGQQSEICLVQSVDNTWAGNWENKRVIASVENVPTQHNPQVHGFEHDFEWCLENPNLTVLEKDGRKLIVLTLSAFYPPQVERSFRQHSVVLVAESMQGPFMYAGDLTRHTQPEVFTDPRSGEAGGMSKLSHIEDKLVGRQHTKAFGVIDGIYRDPSWTLEEFSVDFAEFMEYMFGVLDNNPQTKTVN